jgi:hypothetical protein
LYVVGYEGMIYKMNFDGATFDPTPARATTPAPRWDNVNAPGR